MANSELLKEKYINPTGCPTAHLAKLLGCSRATVYVLIDNPDKCTFTQARSMADAFKIEADDIEEIFLK